MMRLNYFVLNDQYIEGLKKPVKDHVKVNSSSKVTFKSRGYPYCHNVVKPYWFSWGGLPITMEFARKHDLANKWCDITVIDQKGKEWLLPLRHHKRGSSVYIGRPHEFLVVNDLKPGDPIVFELIASGDFPKINFYKLN
ncbi:uncharacterized protein LOC110738548 [Chenopodium quinoa]|uniref:uncharacterized protein LOC110738548 n=1 Tax=Chenopodium quinoa TaxID=63459 RepID=UPI000B76C768|nr:uncharacterized protein LOC110738548 [Chenopodium quinoa]